MQIRSISDMILAVDVHYGNDCASVGGVAFALWSDTKETRTYRSRLCGIDDYVSGQFFQRELPCILKLLEEHSLQPDSIVVDGFVYLDSDCTPGLGKHLFDALGGGTSVVGVAKSRFAAASEAFKVYRGKSKTPLYVTSVGIPLSDAQNYIQSMHGRFRVPSLLKRADRISRE